MQNDAADTTHGFASLPCTCVQLVQCAMQVQWQHICHILEPRAACMQLGK